MECSFGNRIKGILNASLEVLQINEIFLHCKRNPQLTIVTQHRYSKTLQINTSDSINNRIGRQKSKKLDNKCVLILKNRNTGFSIKLTYDLRNACYRKVAATNGMIT